MKPDLSTPPSQEAVDRVGAALAQPLTATIDALPPEVQARLAGARAQALAAAREAREASQVQVEAGGQLSLAGPGRRRLGLAWVPALVLALGLVALSQGQWLQQVLGIGDMDAAVLKDSLPPNAYGDPGFNEYLDEEDRRPETLDETEGRDDADVRE